MLVHERAQAVLVQASDFTRDQLYARDLNRILLGAAAAPAHCRLHPRLLELTGQSLVLVGQR